MAWHTEKHELLRLTNNSLLPATYRWTLFVANEDGTEDEGVGMETESEDELEEEAPSPRALQPDMKTSSELSNVSPSESPSMEEEDEAGKSESFQPQVVVPALMMEPTSEEASQTNATHELKLDDADSGDAGLDQVLDAGKAPVRSTNETPVSTLYVSQPALACQGSLPRIETEERPRKPFPHVPKLDRSGYRVRLPKV